MYIKEIELKNFRNYKNEKISFNEKVNIFLGNNAQGKTNLLEGICLNSISRSFKNARDRELIRFGQEFCKTKTIIKNNYDEIIVEILIKKDGKKGIKIDGRKINKSSELLESIYVIVFSPEDLKIVKDEPEKRRKFINREMCRIRKGYLSDLNNYRKILKQRNTYLKEYAISEEEIDIWDFALAEYGSRIVKRREEFIKYLNKTSNYIHNNISGGKENLIVKYEPNVFFSENTEKQYIELLRRNRKEDIKNRNTGRGPHKDDIKISDGDIDLRKFGSQGQQRTAALSLKLSEIKIIEEETGEKPVLLLDDVLSELDNDRQNYLINSLGENQLFITTTDLIDTVAKNLPEGKIIKISNGKVETEV